jgi:hypothetical protein
MLQGTDGVFGDIHEETRDCAWIDNQTVVQNGSMIGHDPDPNVRQRIILDGDLTQLSD